MKACIFKFYGAEIVARYYLDLGYVSAKDARSIIEEIIKSDSEDSYLTSAEYQISYVDKFGFEVTIKKELLLPQNIKFCNENLEEIWSSLNLVKQQNDCTNLRIELYKNLM